MPRLFTVLLCTALSTYGCFEPSTQRLASQFDTQGHRGARGLHPENTLPGFIAAVQLGVRTLELDLAVSADQQLVVSHEPWFNVDICMLEGSGYSGSTSLYTLDYAAIAEIDCGSKGNADFPLQHVEFAAKPRLADVVKTCDSLARSLGRVVPFYNLEIKSKPSYDGEFSPPIDSFAALVMRFLEEHDLQRRTTVQSFDVRALRAVRSIDVMQRLALLSASPLSAKRELEDLGFTPAVYSPYHLSLRPETVEELHASGVEVVPWTVNDRTRMSTLIRWGVDGLISDYPDRLMELAPGN